MYNYCFPCLFDFLKLQPDLKVVFLLKSLLVITVFMKSHLDSSKQFHVLTIYDCKKHKNICGSKEAFNKMLVFVKKKIHFLNSVPVHTFLFKVFFYFNTFCTNYIYDSC